MDVDSGDSRSSPYLSYFDTSNNFAWRGSRPQEIEHRRALLDDLLIYDILLRSGGNRSPDMLYPPRDEPSLIRLLGAIESSNYDALKKDCLVYFLLKWHQDGREDKFAIQRCIPPQFSALADAYWHLDSGINLAHGIAILADARLNRDYASKILQAISLSVDASTLIRKYVRTAKPPLREPDDITLYTLALADSSLLEAWQYQRTFHEANEIRPRLLKKVLEWCVLPTPKPSALMQLLSLPLSAFEESALHSYVLQPPTTLPLDALPLLQDLICVRLIQLGRYVDAIRMDRQFTASKLGSNSRQAQERAKMVQDLYDALPAIERAFIDAELAEAIEGDRQESTSQRPPNREDINMSQSWEEIRPHDVHPSVPKLSTTHRDSRPISERSNAPRFGGPIPVPSSIPTIPHVPQLPTLLGTATANHHTPRQSFPLPTLPTAFSSPSGSRPRGSLSNTANRLSLGTNAHVSSPLSGTKFPTPANQGLKPAGHGFVSAGKQQNAFYMPPAKVNGHAPQREIAEEDEVNGGDEHMDVEGHGRKRDEDMEVKPAEEPAELGFSVFSNGISGWTNIEDNFAETTRKRATPAGKPYPASVKRKVPGGFAIDDDEEDMDQDGEAAVGQGNRVESVEEIPTVRTIYSKPSTSARSTARSRKKLRSKREESKERRPSPKPSVPGSLVGDEEEDDHLAPLRGKASNRKSLAATGKTSRASTSSDIADELGEGVQTRRRSSRLTNAASSGNVDAGSPETSPKRTSRPKKSTAKAGAGARKRRGA